MNVSIIVAMSRNNVIGISNNMPWSQKSDLKHFKNITNKKVIIMGRKTFESIGRKLPNRTNIVITKTAGFSDLHDVECFGSLEEVLNKYNSDQELMIIGGGQLYKESINLANKFYITYIETNIEKGEVFFPTLPKTLTKVNEEKHNKDADNQYDYTFTEYIAS